MRVLIQLRSSSPARLAAMAGQASPRLAETTEAGIPGCSVDGGYPVVQVPAVSTITGGPLFSFDQPTRFSMSPQASSYLVRGRIPDEELENAFAAAAADPEILGIYADPRVGSCPTCPGDGPSGIAADVANLLGVTRLAARGMDGRNTYVAVVDTGINVEHLRRMGQSPTLIKTKSWAPPGIDNTPGEYPPDHGTMCAYDVGLAAPKAKLLDYALLWSQTPGSTVMEGFLSDAVLAYSRLRQILLSLPLARRRMVITNSWGMFSPDWDFPVGHPGNYSDNPAHPFNIIVGSLENAGADILFAAGNCGRECEDGRCAFNGTPPICGANSHPGVISVGGVDVAKRRVGYSSQGPGRLSAQKPDIVAYTHFRGSDIYDADGGTSAACPVAAGVVAAVRTKFPVAKLSPAQLRSLIFRTTKDMGGLGFDYDYGWGVIEPALLLGALP
jgi:subtilisin family serine protease